MLAGSSHSPRSVFTGENNYVAAGAISPDSKLLVLGGWGQTLNVWDMTDPAKPVLKKALKDHKAGLRSVDFSAMGRGSSPPMRAGW